MGIAKRIGKGLLSIFAVMGLIVATAVVKTYQAIVNAGKWIGRTVSGIFSSVFNFFADRALKRRFTTQKKVVISLNNDMLQRDATYPKEHALGTLYDMAATLSGKVTKVFGAKAVNDLIRSKVFLDDTQIEAQGQKVELLQGLSKHITTKYHRGQRNASAIENFLAWIYMQESRFYADYLMTSGDIRFSEGTGQAKRCLVLAGPDNPLLSDTSLKIQIAGRKQPIVTLVDERYRILDINNPDDPSDKCETINESLSKLTSMNMKDLGKQDILEFLQKQGCPLSLRLKCEIKVDFSKLDAHNPGKFLPNSKAITQTFTLEAVDPKLNILIDKKMQPYLQSGSTSTKSKNKPEKATQKVDHQHIYKLVRGGEQSIVPGKRSKESRQVDKAARSNKNLPKPNSPK